MALYQPIHHPYTCAKELNQRADLFVKLGRYGEANSTLAQALKLWKNSVLADDRLETENEVCLCHNCCSCSNERANLTEMRRNEIRSSISRSIDRRSVEFDDDLEYQESIGSGYLYQKLMRIPCRNLFRKQNVDSVVPMISLLNIAIVHHIMASRSNCRLMMIKSLQLYQLSNDCLHKYITDIPSCIAVEEIGLMFQIILLNNLSHLHCLMGDHLGSRRCIEQLIPIIMCVVDDKVRKTGCRSVGIDRIPLEGIFRNICPLVLTAQCADAA